MRWLILIAFWLYGTIGVVTAMEQCLHRDTVLREGVVVLFAWPSIVLSTALGTGDVCVGYRGELDD